MSDESISAEYHLAISVDPVGESGTPELVCGIRTEREFTSFGYGVKVGKTFSNDTIKLEIGGMTLPTSGGPQPGPATAEARFSMPADGSYTIKVERKSATSTCTVTVKDGKPHKLSDVSEGGLATFTIVE